MVPCTSAKYECGDPSQCPVDGAVDPAFPAWQEGWAERTPGEGRYKAARLFGLPVPEWCRLLGTVRYLKKTPNDRNPAIFL